MAFYININILKCMCIYILEFNHSHYEIKQFIDEECPKFLKKRLEL